jgi:hypothetical protein
MNVAAAEEQWSGSSVASGIINMDFPSMAMGIQKNPWTPSSRLVQL